MTYHTLRRRYCFPKRTKKRLSLLVLLATSLAVLADDRKPSSYAVSVGQNLEVCSFYHDALVENSKKYFPYCNRKFDSPSPPFVALKRSYLDVEEIMKIYDKVESFRLTSNQLFSARIRKRSFLSPNRERAVKFISGLVDTKQLLVWKLIPEIDIDNDGHDDPVLVWQYGRCRGPGGSSPVYGTLLLVLNADGDGIEESKTEAIFGDPLRCVPNQYCPLSNLMTVFVFRSDTYYDAWGHTDASESAEPGLKIDVHKYSHGKVERICELIEEN